MTVTLLKKKKKKQFYRQKLFYNIFTNCWCHFSNFQIIIDKHKCGVSGRPILELIRIYYINSL